MAEVPQFHRYDASAGGGMRQGNVKAVYWRSQNLLRTLGFEVGTPLDILKNYPSLRKTHHGGFWKGLEFRSDVHPWESGGIFKFEFFQNIDFENPNGGQYDFNKLKRMPYLVRLRFLLTMNRLTALWKELGLVDDSKPDVTKLAPLERIKHEASVCFHYCGMDPLVDRQPTESYNSLDRDKQRLRPGEKKCFYGYSGHLMQGRVFYNLNNMWWVQAGAALFNVSAGELFDWRHGLPRRRKVDELPKLKSALTKAVGDQNFERAIVLRDLMKGRVAA